MASFSNWLRNIVRRHAAGRLFSMVTVLVLVVPSVAPAQSVIGRSVIEGQPVELLDNQTWRFAGSVASPTPAGCELVRAPFSFCASGSLWRRLPGGADPSVSAEYILNDITYGMFIVEGLGLSRGMSLAAMRTIVLQNAAAFIGGTASDIPVLDTFQTTIDGVLGETMIYTAQIEGLDVVYANSLIVADDYTAQIITYSIGNTFSAPHREAHTDFLSRVRIEG